MRLQSDNCLLYFQDISLIHLFRIGGREIKIVDHYSLCLIHSYRPVDVLSDVQL